MIEEEAWVRRLKSNREGEEESSGLRMAIGSVRVEANWTPFYWTL